MRNVFAATLVATILVPPFPVRIDSLTDLLENHDINILASKGGTVSKTLKRVRSQIVLDTMSDLPDEQFAAYNDDVLAYIQDSPVDLFRRAAQRVRKCSWTERQKELLESRAATASNEDTLWRDVSLIRFVAQLL